VNYAVFVYFLSLTTLCSRAIDTVSPDMHYFNASPYQQTNLVPLPRRNNRRFSSFPKYHSDYRRLNTPEVDLWTCSAAQLALYFFSHRYSEKDILSLHVLYMFDEFVKLAKTYPGYEAAITSLHKKLCKRSDFVKWLGSRIGTHCSGLTARIANLYQELQEQKQADQAAKQWQIEEQQRQTKADISTNKNLQ
jgi:hypothetical protein